MVGPTASPRRGGPSVVAAARGDAHCRRPLRSSKYHLRAQVIHHIGSRPDHPKTRPRVSSNARRFSLDVLARTREGVRTLFSGRLARVSVRRPRISTTEAYIIVARDHRRRRRPARTTQRDTRNGLATRETDTATLTETPPHVDATGDARTPVPSETDRSSRPHEVVSDPGRVAAGDDVDTDEDGAHHTRVVTRHRDHACGALPAKSATRPARPRRRRDSPSRPSASGFGTRRRYSRLVASTDSVPPTKHIPVTPRYGNASPLH
ncbi:hypothetical protein J2754_003268 [Halarchaeum solikamskense]|nr:hypothetical protein [Halarchaeum solikamskense]